MRQFKRSILLMLFILAATSWMSLAPSHAQTVQAADKAPVTQSYGTDTTVQQGMIVELSPKDSTKVDPLKATESSRMLGVVVAANDAALSLTSDTASRQVYVATFGKYSVLVSNQDGVIKAGDYVTISSLDGVGMKATSDVPIIVGKALSGFDGSSNVEGSATLTGSGGKQQVSLGRVNVQVGVQSNPLYTGGDGINDFATQFLTRIGYKVTNKTVSPARLYLAVVIMVIAALVAASILYSGVRTSIQSIGRNPLAKKVILRGLIQVILTSLIIFIIGIFAVYLLLKL